ncbi:MAG: nucleotidyltransferase family protein [bacterium]
MDLKKIKKRIEERYDKRHAKLESRRVKLLNKIKAGLTEILCEFPSVSKIAVYGSLVRAGYFTELSDVDIAVKDLPNSEYWKALLWLERCLEFENIDLVRIEDAKPIILKYIDKGDVIYEKEIRELKNSEI